MFTIGKPADAQHKNTVDYIQSLLSRVDKHYTLRSRFELIDRAYQREEDTTKEHTYAKVANTYGDTTKLQNIVIPVVMPQVETATAYQSAVFLTSVPLISVNSTADQEDQAKSMEALLESQAIKGSWRRQLQLAFRNAFKYNISAVECSWQKEVTQVITTDVTADAGSKVTKVEWEGNAIKALNMYTTFWDMRVIPSEVSTKGEYAGYVEYYSLVAIKDLITKLGNDVYNAKEALASAPQRTTRNLSVPLINSALSITETGVQGEFDWSTHLLPTAVNSIDGKYSGTYCVTTVYARIIPETLEYKVVSNPKTPQIWKFIVVNDSIIIYAKLQDNAHGKLPILFFQPLDDGLGYNTKSLAENVLNTQQVCTALSNANIASKRRAVSDRTYYDPVRISSKDINSTSPAPKIPVKASNYGKPISDAVHTVPYRDDQSATTTQQMSMYLNLANVISGQNPARQGQFVKGNKTQDEFNQIMSNASERDQMCSIMIEDQLMTPLKEMLKTNILQYQGGISLYDKTTKKELVVDPVKLRQSVLEFTTTDGLTPASKVLRTDVMQVALQTFASSPQLGAGYDLSKLVSYLFKTQGADIGQFEKPKEQLAYEQAVMQWQQAVQGIMEAASKGGIDPKQLQIPPQPTPEQFGYKIQGQQ